MACDSGTLAALHCASGVLRRTSSRELGALLAMAVAMLAVNAARAVVSYKALDLGANDFEVGLIAGVYSFLPFALGMPIGMNVDRYGGGTILVLGALSGFVGCAALFASSSLWALGAGYALLGLAQITVAISIQSLAATTGDESGRDTRFARVAVAASVGQLGGPLVAAVTVGTGPANTSLTLGVATVISVLSIIAATYVMRKAERLPHQSGAAATSPRLRDALRRPDVAPVLSASVAALVTQDMVIAYLPVVAEERSISASFVGLLLSLSAGAGLVSRALLVPLLSRMPSRAILMGGMGLASLGGLAIAFADLPWVFAVSVLALGSGLGVSAPIVSSWMAGAAPISERGTHLALRMTSNRLGQSVIPPAIGGLAVLLGPASVFLFVGVVLVSSVGGLTAVSMDIRPQAENP